MEQPLYSIKGKSATLFMYQSFAIAIKNGRSVKIMYNEVYQVLGSDNGIKDKYIRITKYNGKTITFHLRNNNSAENQAAIFLHIKNGGQILNTEVIRKAKSYTWHNYFRFYILFVAIFSSLFLSEKLGILYWWEILFEVVRIAMMVALFVTLKKYNRIGYRLLFIYTDYSILNNIISVFIIRQPIELTASLFSGTIGISVVLLPTLFYYQKRKHLFK